MGGGSNVDEYINTPYSSFDNVDWTGLKTSDRIELRTGDGAYVEGPFVIASFGSNESAAAEDANDAQINVTASITNATWTGTYVTFSPWVAASNTANMDLFAAFSDAANENLDGDDPKEWA